MYLKFCFVYSVNKNNTNQQKVTDDRLSAAVVMWMEQDVLRRLAGKSENSGGGGCNDTVGRINGVALAATTRNWWSQLKTAGAAIYANRHYLALREQRERQLPRSLNLPLPLPMKCRLVTANPEGRYSTIGNVYVHPSAQVHPTALVNYILFLLLLFIF